MPATRDPRLEFLNEKPQIRKALIYLPERVMYAVTEKRAGGIKIDTKTGRIVEYIFGGPLKISYVSTILEKNGKRYFGSLKTSIAVINTTSTSQEEGKVNTDL